MTPLPCTNAPSTARSFIRLASRSLHSTANKAAPISGTLEFLVPRHAVRATATSAARNPLRQPVHLPLGSYGFLSQRVPGRGFTASASRQATVCVQHPITDEDGNAMMLEITPRAAKRLSDIMAKDANPNLALRIQVESGGCHGFQYLMSLVTIPEKGSPEWSEVIKEDDTIFEFAPDENEAAPLTNAPKVILDEPSLELLKGSKVDFTMELIGSQFKITDNPYASSSCGCGTSFDIKM